VIEASAPVRICDIGGWTDTWFGGPGRVLNIAVSPRVEVSIRARPGRNLVVLDLESFAERYTIVPGASRSARHRLLEAAVDALPPPDAMAVQIGVRASVPAGCGAGTSAAVTVALMGALFGLRGENVAARDAAYAAHRLEVDVLGGESGVQDQLSAAFGGINYLEIEPYPEARVTTLPAWAELNARLTLVFLGRAHDSSGLHRQVIENGWQRSAALSRLRTAAVAARDAVLTQDLEAFGRAMIDNTEGQSSLHPGLVGADATRVIQIAAARGAIGWKVNGAGGDGGSVTILSANDDDKRTIEHHIAAIPSYRLLPVRLSAAGLQVRKDT
jgi:D-glycero-alpha-D-manno-heptose-7-phosphate kinase